MFAKALYVLADASGFFSQTLDESDSMDRRGQTEKSNAATASTIDFAKYRTKELGEQIGALISVPGAFFTVLKTAFLFFVLTGVICFAIHSSYEMSLGVLIPMCIYGLFAATVLGGMFGVVRVIALGMGNIESILKITLETTAHVAADYDQVSTGQQRLPSAAELVGLVTEKVVMPVVENVVASSFGFLGTPLLWLHRRTIGSSVRFLVKQTAESSVTDDEAERIEGAASTGLETAAKYSTKVRSYTDRALSVVSKTGRTINGFVMRPIYVAFVVALACASVPVVVVVCLFGE